MKISISELEKKILGLLTESLGEQSALRVTEYLLWAEKSGIKTQGILKLTGTEPLQKIVPKGPITIEKETKLSQLINANSHPAPLVAQIATDAAIEKAKEHGFAIVAARNTFSSNGAQAFYAERMAREGLIGIVLSRSPGSTCAFDSIDPVIGTNPFGIAFPTNGHPLVFDLASSAMTWYGLVLARARGEELSPEMAIDSDGNPTCDPSAAMKGAILPFDKSYKSSAIGLIVEILAGPLAGSAYCDFKTFDKEWGSIFAALDPALLVERSDFMRHCSELVGIIRGSRKRAGASEIRLPGDRARKAREEAERSGFVEVEERVLEELGFNY